MVSRNGQFTHLCELIFLLFISTDYHNWPAANQQESSSSKSNSKYLSFNRDNSLIVFLRT